MGEVPGCNSISYTEAILVAHPEKHPHTSRLLEVDLSPVSPRPLRQGSLANPLTIPHTWTRTPSRAKYPVCPPEIQHEYRPACRR